MNQCVTIEMLIYITCGLFVIGIVSFYIGKWGYKRKTRKGCKEHK